MAARAEVVGTFAGLEDIDEAADQVPQAGDGSFRCLSQHGLEFGEACPEQVEGAFSIGLKSGL